MRSMAPVLLTLLLGLFAPSAAQAATVIGAVSRVAGTSEGAVEGTTRTLAAGLPVHLDEVVTTGVGARLEITFDDGTRLTVGENASVTLDAFVHVPGGESVFAATVAGAFRFASAALGPGETRRCDVTTPFAVIGVRGTDFWGGPIDGAFGVFLIDGAITVASAGSETSMSAPGQGVTVSAIGDPPGEIVIWAQEKIDRAFATVTFP